MPAARSLRLYNLLDNPPGKFRFYVQYNPKVKGCGGFSGKIFNTGLGP
jgi:hypothetical protein